MMGTFVQVFLVTLGILLLVGALRRFMFKDALSVFVLVGYLLLGGLLILSLLLIVSLLFAEETSLWGNL